MKQRTTFFLTAVMAVFMITQDAFAQKDGKANIVTLTVRLKGLLARKIVYYAPDNKDFEAKKDSLLTETGGFTVKINIPEGQGDAYRFQFGKTTDPKRISNVYLESGDFLLTSPTVFMSDPGVTFSGGKTADEIQAFKKFFIETLTPLDPMLALQAMLPTHQQWVTKHPESSFAIYILDKFNEVKAISDEDAIKIIKRAPRQALNNVHGRALLTRLKENKETSKN